MAYVDLQSLQTRFGKAMLGERDALPTDCIHPAGGLSPAQSVEVYCHNRQGALLRVLHDVYPVCAQLLGSVRFRGIASGYVRLYPSEHSDLNLYGEDFADFLQLYCDEHAVSGSLACLPELARLEWHYHFAYYAADDATFDFAGFEKIEESEYERIVFELSRSLALISSSYPLYSIWHSRRAADQLARSESLCVCRDGLRPVLKRLPTGTYELLSELAAGATLGALSRRFHDLAQRLPRLLTRGWVTSFHFKVPPDPRRPGV